MLHKCSTDCIWKGMQPVNDLQRHSRSLPLLPFDSPYTISYYSAIVSVCQSCTVFQILTLICQKLGRHVTLTTPTCRTVCHHHKTNTSRINPCTKFDDCILSHSREIKGGAKFWNGSRDPGHAFLGDGRRPKANTRYSLQPHKIWRLCL